MPERNVIQGVQSISTAIQDILRFRGTNDESHLLLAKSVIRGARDFDELNLPYGKANVASKRAEGVMIEHALRHSGERLREEDSASIGKDILSRAMLETLLEKHTTGQYTGKSLILPPLSEYLHTHGNDARGNLIIIGEQFDHMLDVKPTNTYITPFDVNLNRLDGRHIGLNMKRIFREYKRVQEIAEQLRRT